MLMTEKNATEIIHPNDDPKCRSARDSILKAVAAVEEAKDRLERLQVILWESRDSIESIEATLDTAEAQRDVLIFERDLELARRAEAQIRKELLKRLRLHYEPKFRESLKKLDAVFSGPVWEANEAARLIWNEANAAGVKMPTHFCQHFLPDGPRMTSWHHTWQRVLRNEGWLDD